MKQDYLTLIAHNDNLQTLPKLARGNICFFLIHWIVGGCFEVTDYKAAVDIPERSWLIHERRITLMLLELMPKIKVAYEKMQASEARIQARNKKAVIALLEYHKAKKIEKNKHLVTTDKKSFENSDVQGMRPALLSDSEYITPAFIIKNEPKPGSGMMKDKGKVKI